MSAHVLLKLLNEFRKRDKMRGFNKFINTRAGMLDSIYLMTVNTQMKCCVYRGSYMSDKHFISFLQRF